MMEQLLWQKWAKTKETKELVVKEIFLRHHIVLAKPFGDMMPNARLTQF